jgi:hypothetical protein
LIFFGLKYVISFRIRDPGRKKVGSGINILDPPHCKKVHHQSVFFFIPLLTGTVGTFRSIFLDNGKKNVTKQFQSWGFSIFLLVDGRIPTEPDPYR